MVEFRRASYKEIAGEKHEWRGWDEGCYRTDKAQSQKEKPSRLMEQSGYTHELRWRMRKSAAGTFHGEFEIGDIFPEVYVFGRNEPFGEGQQNGISGFDVRIEI